MIFADSAYDGRSTMWSKGEFQAAEKRNIDCYLCKGNAVVMDSDPEVAEAQLKRDCRGPVPCVGAANSPSTLNGQIFHSNLPDSSRLVSNTTMLTKDLTEEIILGGDYPDHPNAEWLFSDSTRMQAGDVDNEIPGILSNTSKSYLLTLVNNPSYTSYSRQLDEAGQNYHTFTQFGGLILGKPESATDSGTSENAYGGVNAYDPVNGEFTISELQFV